MAVNAIEMSVSDWVDVKDNPRQRNTEKRASSAARKHLSDYQKIHRVVFAATKNGNILCKLDGHTRALLWDAGELSHPPEGTVVVNLIEVGSLDEAKEVYDQLDAPPSVKKPSDKIFGACRERKIRLTSHLLRSCAFSTQLKIATTGKRFSGDIYEMVDAWGSELKQLDSWGLTSNYTILIAVMLTAIRMDGEVHPKEFFSLLDTEGGTKTAKGYDAVQLLNDVISVRRAEGRTSGYENLMQIAGQAWTAYTMHKDGKRKLRAGLKAANFTNVVLEEALQCQ